MLTSEKALVVLATLLVIVLMVAYPLAAIVCVNKLFGLTIEYTITNWFYTFVLIAAVGGFRN